MRAKSCQSCRAAKARYSQLTPCARCSTRGSLCIYDSAGEPSQRRSTSLRPLLAAPSSSADYEDPLLPGVISTNREKYVSVTANTARLPSPQPTIEVQSAAGEQASQELQEDDRLLLDVPWLPLSLPNSNCPSWGLPLTQRGRSLQQGALTARMLLNQLASWTRMMAEGRILPPFIHGSCSSNGGHKSHGDMFSDGLPRILRLCAINVRELLKTDGNSRQRALVGICGHISEMHCMVSSYTTCGRRG